MELPKEIEEYFEMLQKEIDKAYEIAKKARAQGKDPSLDVEIPQATDMAGRVESLVGPPGVAERIRELVKEYGKEIAALKIVDEIIEGKFGDFGSKEKYAEQAVRTALAILTEGVVSAPIEGIAAVKIKRNSWADDSEYLALYYAGPIRSSGGTAQALSVLVGDYVRRKLGLDRFKPSEKHIERMVEEVDLYHRAVTRLQYHPSPEEVRLAMRNIPIEITGEATDDVEVSHRDVPGVETNNLRGGAILVLAEGVLQKAKKLVKYIDKMGIDGWEWLKEFVEAKEKGESIEENNEEVSEPSVPENNGNDNAKNDVKMGFYYTLYKKFEKEIAPSDKYAKEVIGGRPLLSDPSKNGGFRLRYGRSRASGFASWGINPATMILVDGFLAIGTQLKTERPGKGAVVTPVTTAEGPIVKLKDGSVLRVDDYRLALEIRDKVEEILYLGDAVIAFGDFVENNQTLLPANYCEEWWIQEFVKAVKEIYEVELKPFEDNPEENIEEAADYLEIDPEFLRNLLRDPLRVKPPVELAIHFSEILGIPFHPYYTLYWNSVEPEKIEKLWKILKNAEIEWDNFRGIKFARKVVISMNELGDSKRTLELLGLPHRVEGENIVIEYPWSAALLTPLGNLEWEFRSRPHHMVIDIINENNEIKLRDRGISWIGARMGRPEKAKERKMKPPVQVLFPIGLAGGNSRDIKKAAEEGKEAEVEIAFFKCPKCGHVGPEHLCPRCGTRKELIWTCPKCKAEYTESQAQGYDYTCPKCNIKLKPYAKRKIKPSELLKAAMDNVKVYGVDKLKGVMGMTSGWKMPEPLEKGLLRAKNDVYVFKDGTIRFDATDAPITHFRPREIGVSVEKLRELGYTHDFEGKPLVSEDQIVELKPQDVILSKEAGKYLLKVARFVDDLLEKFYGLPRFYNAERIEDLIGHLVIGLAPHTSAGIVGRIIGFVDALVGYAHPYFHAAKRRNCFPGDTRILVQINGKPSRITLKELYELFEGESYENMVYVKRKPKVDIKVYSLDPETGKVVLTDIEDVIKAPSTDHLIRFELELGRSFETTVDHPVLVYENGRFVEKRAFEVKEGDRILVPRPEFPEIKVEHLDVLEEFAKEDFKKLWDKVTVKGLDEWLKLDGLGEDSVPLDVLLKFLKDKGIQISEVPKCSIGFKGEEVSINRFIPIRPLMRVLGYYLAKGYARESYQIIFSITNEETRENLKKALREAFGDNLEIYERNGEIIINSSLLYLLFTEVLKAGKNAHTKRVPSIVYTLPKDIVAEMLRAYFEGNGIVLTAVPRVVIYSVNKALLEDIETLLLSRFGIVGYYTTDALKIEGEQYRRLFEEIVKHSTHSNKGHDNGKYSCELGWVVKVRRIDYIRPKDDFVFSLNAKKYHNVLINENIITHQCDGDEDAVMLLLDALLNFSRYYLPEKRGGKMDAPLVITTRLDPREVDSEVHNMDIVRYYPLEFYEATYELKSPKEFVGIIERVEDRLGKPEMYYGLKFTHDTDDIALGPKMSLYKQLADMDEKVKRQLDLAKRLRAVDEHKVAEIILNSHLIPDLRGNLRSFTRQEFRCVKCNTKFRRPPLDGKCPVCGGKIVLTVSKGAIEKYLGTAKLLVTEYKVKEYTRQRICLTERDIDSLFENVFPETQLTLMINPNDICQRMILARTGEGVRGGLLENLKSLNNKEGVRSEKSNKKAKEKPKKKKVISLEDFFSKK